MQLKLLSELPSQHEANILQDLESFKVRNTARVEKYTNIRTELKQRQERILVDCFDAYTCILKKALKLFK